MALNRYLIIADDFTGANDTGVQLKRRGLDTSVVFSAEAIKSSAASFVIDTESRGMSGEEAYRTVKEILAGVDFSGFRYVIKKVDSTLRGNIAWEVRAVDEAFGSELVLFAPALPDLKRTTVGGIHRLNGVPITNTEMAKDPKKPVREDHLGRLLKEAYSEEIVHVPLEEVQRGEMDLSKSRIYTFDAVSNADMQNIVRAGLKSGKKVLWVGTAAMADNLLEIEMKTAPVLCVVASLSSVTREQVKFARQNGISLVPVPVHELIEGKSRIQSIIDEAVKLLKEGKDTMLLSSASHDPEEYQRSLHAGEKKGMSPEEISRFTQDTIGEAAKEIIKQAEVSGVFLTGGDTAMGFFDKVGSLGSSIVEEIAIGIPLMKLVGGPFEGLKVVTKAGAFGREDAISYAVRKLKEATR